MLTFKLIASTLVRVLAGQCENCTVNIQYMCTLSNHWAAPVTYHFTLYANQCENCTVQSVYSRCVHSAAPYTPGGGGIFFCDFTIFFW